MFAVLAALAVLLPGPVYRSGGWSLETAFAVLRWAVYAGLAAVSRGETPDWSDRNRGTRVHDYYGVRPYWGP